MVQPRHAERACVHWLFFQPWFRLAVGGVSSIICRRNSPVTSDYVNQAGISVSIRMHSCRHTVLAAFSSIAVAGCTPEVHRHIKFPDLFHPGNAPNQRAEAIEHDPYPLDDAGPPVVGGRPLGYQAGVPEVERSRLNAPPPPGLQPIVVPGLPGYPVAPPPAVTTPYSPAPPASSPPFIQQRRSPY